MDPSPRLMAVLAHPDDESLGFGGTLARYAAEGIDTHLLCATRGELGWPGAPDDYPGADALARIRERELAGAAAVLGIADVTLLREPDGGLREVDGFALAARIAGELRRARPDVVVTFGPDGAYGHPDHVAISQAATTALLLSADPSFRDPAERRPHRVAKLYYRVWTATEAARHDAVFGAAAIEVDGHSRIALAWPDWGVSARIETAAHWQTVRDAVACHQSQLGGSTRFLSRSPGEQRALWTREEYYRAISTVSAGDAIEHDLFAGIRPALVDAAGGTAPRRALPPAGERSLP